MIRWIQSDFWEDFSAELRYLGVREKWENLVDRFNPNLTFKIGALSAAQIAWFRSYLQQHGVPFWLESKNENPGSLIVSFPNRQIVYTLIENAVTELGSVTAALKLVLKNISRSEWCFSLPQSELKIDRPLIMGILNITPDSFSDGGKFLHPEKAARHALQMADAGADMIDLGAESTRPGAQPVGLEEEWQRIQPVLRQIRAATSLPISVDTYKAEIARRALSEGADVINDISGFTFDPQVPAVVASAGVPVVLMHIKGAPRNMQQNPRYQNLMEEIFLFLNRQIGLARTFGIQQIIVDPGIGFGKRLADNFEIIRRLKEFSVLGVPILVGPSRKSFLRTGKNLLPQERVWGTAAAVALSIANGAHIVRVHDVAEMRKVIEIVQSIQTAKSPGE